MAKPKEFTFPALNATEAEQIVRELGRALDNDRAWADAFRTMLVCRTKPKTSDLDENAQKHTVFGKWYYGQKNDNLRKHPGYAEVGQNSEKMHALARQLAAAIRDGADITPKQFKAFVKSADHFRRSLRELLSEAWEFLRYADPLTGVMTRGAMNMRLEEEQERSKRSSEKSYLAMMDLDHFKEINDTHGHSAGDKVLAGIARYLDSNLRRYDQIFRYGGEEFLILLPSTSAANAKRVLDRMRANIKRDGVDIGNGETLHVSASFGVALLRHDSPPEDSIDLADQALYSAKKAGRNCVKVWKGDME